MQIAVKKYLKLTLNQPNSDHMAPFSSNDLKQVSLFELKFRI